MKSPGILHIATHGFFLADQKTDSERDLDKKKKKTVFPNNPFNNFAKLNIENPLVRSGIALAGANAKGDLDERLDDGLATAMELSGMDLRGTDLVILSACDTGVGKNRKGQGVIGLRRAFQQAGARSLVMSLWKIPDEETKDLMVDFYNRLKNGKSKLTALREASLAVMRTTKDKTGSTNPFYWGGFILIGSPEGHL